MEDSLIRVPVPVVYVNIIILVVFYYPEQNSIDYYFFSAYENLGKALESMLKVYIISILEDSRACHDKYFALILEGGNLTYSLGLLHPKTKVRSINTECNFLTF